MGYVVIAGLFEPGTVVELFPVEDHVLRVGAQDPVGQRIADSIGSVGFSGCEVGQRYIARGTDGTTPLEVVCRGQAEGDVNEISQPPIGPVPQAVGTQERIPPAERPAEPNVILHTGVPSGLPAGVST